MGRISRAKYSSVALHKRYNNYVFLFIVLALIFFPPFFRGLFFEKDQYIMHIFTGIIFISYIFSRKQETSINSINVFHILMFVYITSYFISVFGSARMSTAVNEFLNVLNYFLIFYLVADLNGNGEKTNYFLNALYWSSVLVALTGILTALGIASFPDAYRPYRIYSTLQYPNALSVYVISMAIIGIVRIKDVLGKIPVLLYSLGLVIQFSTFFGSQSRGGILVFLLTYSVFLLFNRIEKGRVLIITISSVVIGLISGYFLMEAVKTGNALGGLFAVFTGSLLLFIILDYLKKKDFSCNFGRKGKIIVLLFLLIITIILAIAIIKNLDLVNISRYFNILSHTDAEFRIVFSKDALAMFLDNPLFGYGGGGWNAAYKEYRTYPYFTTEVHNHYLETAVEVGIVGLIPFVLAIAYSLYVSYKNRNNLFLWGTGCAVFAFAAHAVIDFDLSLGAINIIFWVLIALTAYKGFSINPKISLTPLKWLSAGLLIFYILASFSFIAALDYNVKSNVYKSQNKINEMIEYTKKSVKSNPFHEQYIGNLGKINEYMYEQTNDTKYLDEALKNINKAISLDPYNTEWMAQKALILLLKGNFDESVLLAKSIPKHDKYNSVSYLDAGFILLNLGRNYLNVNNDAVKARECFEQVLEIWKLAEKNTNSVPPDKEYYWRTTKPTKDPVVNKNTAIAYLYLNNFKKAEEFFDTFISQDERSKYWAYYVINKINPDTITDEKTRQEVLNTIKIIDAVN